MKINILALVKILYFGKVVLDKTLKNRKFISVLIFVITFAIIVFINAIIIKKTNNYSTLYLILIPIMGIINEFLPDIIYKIGNVIKDESAKNKKYFVDKFYLYLNEYYGLKKIQLKLNYKQDFYLILEDIILTYKIDDKYKYPLLILYFIIFEAEFSSREKDFNPLTFIKNKYRDNLKDKERVLFINLYFSIVILNSKYSKVDKYFSDIEEKDYERGLFTFLNYYSKDDCLNYMMDKVKFEKGKIIKFQNSLGSIIRNKNLSLRFLSDLLNKNKQYSKGFLLVSENKLPSKIQTYIKQNPYFILNSSSLANLPTIGTSERFDVFLFSPHKMYPSPSVLFNEFCKIDKATKNHPLKIYSLDPFESFENKIELSNEFMQAVSYFEFGSYDFTSLEKLNKQQLLSILETNKISLRDIIQELPISAFSEKIQNNEKELFDQIGELTLVAASGYNVFNILKSKDFSKKIKEVKPINIHYTKNESKKIFKGKVTKPKLNARMDLLYKEIKININTINELFV